YQLKDRGVAGATVYLDENNNGQPDAGEPRAATDGDGVYRFLHDFNPEAPSSNPDSPRQVVAGALRPLASAAVQAISQGPVTTAAPHGFSRGGVFQFQGLANALGVQNGVTYYVVDTPTDTTFTFATRPGGPALAAASAAGATAVAPATTITAHNLQPGWAFTFTDPARAAGVTADPTHSAADVRTPSTFFFTTVRGGPILTGASATGGGVVVPAFRVLSTPIRSFQNGTVGQSGTVVVTGEPHNLSVGQALTF